MYYGVNLAGVTLTPINIGSVIIRKIIFNVASSFICIVITAVGILTFSWYTKINEYYVIFDRNNRFSFTCLVLTKSH
jgi:hypothetical protein